MCLSEDHGEYYSDKARTRNKSVGFVHRRNNWHEEDGWRLILLGVFDRRSNNEAVRIIQIIN